MGPAIAIVILNYNGRHYLETFLPSVVASSYPNREIIVADNASTDDSVAWLLVHYPTIRLILLDRNYGFATGYNKALEQVDADYYVLLNSDVEVDPGWLEPMAELLEKDHRIGACQPKILSYTNRDVFEYAGGAGGWLDHMGYPFAKGRIFDTCEKDRGQYDQTGPIAWASGAALFIRAVLYHQSGGLDGYFFAHQEEIDLCWRLQLSGHFVYSCPSARVWHVGGGTLPKGNARKVFLNFRNNLIMLAKNLPAGELVWKLPLRFQLDALSAWKSLFTGDFAYFGAVLRAHLAFFKWLLVGRKASVLPEKKGTPSSGWYRGNIVWQYFVRGKKTFGEIMNDKT